MDQWLGDAWSTPGSVHSGLSNLRHVWLFFTFKISGPQVRARDMPNMEERKRH